MFILGGFTKMMKKRPVQPERTGGKGLFSFAYLKQNQSKKRLKC